MEISRRDVIASIAIGVAGHRKIASNGISMHIAEQGQGALIILCHGFPESWYSWRHQIPFLADAGYHVVAPDMRGYGGTEGPLDQSAYSIMDLVGDMVGIVTALGENHAIIVGHDWGATVAWHSALLRPDVFLAVVAMSVPFRQRQPEPPLRLLRRSGLYTYYWLYYQDPGVAEAEYDGDPKETLLRTLYTFSGDAPHGESNRRILEPGKGALDSTLLIAGGEDHVIRGPTGKAQLDAQATTVPGLRRQLIIDGAGHYIQQERPARVTAVLIDFLRGLPA